MNLKMGNMIRGELRLVSETSNKNIGSDVKGFFFIYKINV